MTSRAETIDAAALALLDEAFDAPADERRAVILDRTKHDPELRERTLALFDTALDHDDAPITGGGLRILDETLAPDVIGNYRIEREIGRGGMGSVYLGRRIAGDFDHAAAIKLVRLTGRSKVFSDRLRSERRLLAQLKHPNIAQLHDGGETEDGAPYFIMEYVDGAPLYDYLRTHEADLAERLRIFTEVCSAIAYAHRNLVIHRDLSPANVLISRDGAAKLIDFGISHTIGEGADANGPRLTMTKGYTAPERMRGEPTTTLSDIYSLGVMLNELTAGAKAPRAGDLAAIVAKARADEPGERYLSVEALLDDMGRYQAGRSVSAVKGQWPYAVRRFIQRRKFAVAAASLAAVSIVATSVVTTVLYLRADRAEKQAVEQFEAVRSLAKYMLFDLHDEIARIPGSTRAREMLADTGRRYLDALSRTEDASSALKIETALGYKRLGDVLGNAAGGNLGRRTEAGEMLETAYAQLSALKAQSPDNSDALRAFADTSYALAIYNFVIRDDSDAAIEKAADAEKAYRKLAASPRAAAGDRLGIANALTEQGLALVWMNKGEEAIERIKAAQAIIDDLLAADPQDEGLLKARAQSAIDFGDTISRHVDQRGGEQAPALAQLDDGIARFRALRDAGNADFNATRSYIAGLWKRALVLYVMERDEDALVDLNEADDLLKPLIARDPEDLGLFRMRLSVLSQKALSYRYVGRLDEATAAAEENVAGRRRLLDLEPDSAALKREMGSSIMTLGDIRKDREDNAGACARYREAKSYLVAASDTAAGSEYFGSLVGGELEKNLASCDPVAIAE